MALTEEQLKELALRVDAHLCSEGHVATSAAYAIAFAANLVAALPKPEPVGNLNNGKFFWNTQGGPEKWRDRQNYDGPLYAEAPIAQPASAPSEQKPRFECWSTNEGDSWYEHPADAELLYDVLGNSPKVGDEFEVMAGWCSVQARYRIASQTDDDFEVECISHPESNTAPQPDYKAQRDATQAISDVIAERLRQQSVEGWTPEHDDSHTEGEMAAAAACYALSGAGNWNKDALWELWPRRSWSLMWFKPKTKRADLVRAGALILAEIERIDRAAIASVKGGA